MDLQTYIQAHISKPFKWGTNDCCIFVGEWIRIKTGRDYLIEHRPWRNKREAVRKLRDLNGLSFFLDQHFISINPNMAKDGDLAIFEGTACIFSGRHVVSVGESGLVFRSRLGAAAAWTV